VHVVLHDESGQPLAGVAYELEAQGERFDGTTNADGAVRERVDIRAREAQLQLFPDGRDHPARVVRFAIGHLDPPSTDSGIRGRLINLGYDRSEPDADAVRAFQRDAGLDAHGEVDVATLEKLRDAHRA
jgi:peptidoglycan hydrolase-like protein with peptidoglycan-binding domain